MISGVKIELPLDFVLSWSRYSCGDETGMRGTFSD